MTYYLNLREYISELERNELLFSVLRPINKDTEMHPLVRWQFRGLVEEKRRAFYFPQVFDSTGGQFDIPVLVGGLAGSQKIYALGLKCKENEVADVWRYALEHPIDPVLSSSGPIKHKVYKGAELLAAGGLKKLPVPISTPGFDNAPYLTAGCWITKDPETGVRNMAIYRGQIKGALKTGISWGSLKDSAVHWEKCKRLGIPLEAAVIIGGPPSIAYAAVQRVALGVDELSIAGGLAQEPLELVKCETIDLEVPAQADIVIEGTIPTDYLEPDGPFGESHGYEDPGDLTAVFNVSCICYRPDPIFVSLISQLTPSESSKIKQTAFEAFALKHLRTKFGNSIIKASLYEDLLNRQMVVIQVQKSGSELKWMVMEELLRTKASGKFIVCVDADIDPGDLPSVMWAIVNRSQPHRDVKIVSNRPLPWNPTRFVADGEKYDRTDSSLLIDATLKADFPPVALPAKEFMERARIIWDELGLPELSPRAPWYGYSLGYWPEENVRQAENAVAGDYLANAAVLHSKGIKVNRDDRFVDLKERYLSTQLASLRKSSR